MFEAELVTVQEVRKLTFRQPTNVTIRSHVQELANTCPEALQRCHPDKGILNGVGEHHWVCYCCMHQLSKSQFKAQVAHGGIWCSAQAAFDDRVDTLSASFNHSHLNLRVGQRPKGQRNLIYQRAMNPWTMYES